MVAAAECEGEIMETPDCSAGGLTVFNDAKAGLVVGVAGGVEFGEGAVTRDERGASPILRHCAFKPLFFR